MLNYAEFYFWIECMSNRYAAIANRFTLADAVDGDPHLCGDVVERFGAGGVGADGQNLHFNFGVSVFALMLIRLAVRSFHAAPPTTPPLE